MKKFYEEFFYVSRNGNVREKVMLARISVSIVLMLICIVAMSFSAYAYFSANITTHVKPIRSAHYQLNVTVKSPEGLAPNASGEYILDNETGNTSKAFTFNIAIDNQTTTATVGFCKIRIQTSANAEGTYQVFYTEPIGTFTSDGQTVTDNDRVISVVIPKGQQAKITFVSQWGSCAVQERIVAENNDGVAALDSEIQFVQPSSDRNSDSNGIIPPVNSTDTGTEFTTSSASSSDTQNTQNTQNIQDTQNTGTPMDTSTTTEHSTTSDVITSTDTPAQTENSTDSTTTLVTSPASSDVPSATETQNSETPVDSGTANDTSTTVNSETATDTPSQSDSSAATQPGTSTDIATPSDVSSETISTETVSTDSGSEQSSDIPTETSDIE